MVLPQVAQALWEFVGTLILSRLVFASDGVRVGIVIGVVRALMTLGKSKIGVVRGVIGSTESESEESERFHFLPTPLRSAYKLVKTRLS